ncbi:hypothetical protein [Pseudarthrobacter sp. NPDC080039]|uniref:hypothetical protein n=1 Tax=unclassified Pseudarthrobacter TaxID=2647000 RepID=UPI003450C6DC
MLDEFEYGLGLGPGAPGLLTIITGARGIGKTALLSAAQGKARQQGWIVISEIATPGFVGPIGETMRLHLEELAPRPGRTPNHRPWRGRLHSNHPAAGRKAG